MKNQKIKPHEFVLALQERKTRNKVIRGYVGKAENSYDVRVYLDAELVRYVDVPEKSILHVEDARVIHGPTASIAIWVDEQASIRHFGHWFANEDPTTMATGEEGGGDPTTMATGEESASPFDRINQLINPSPFGTFS